MAASSTCRSRPTAKPADQRLGRPRGAAGARSSGDLEGVATGADLEDRGPAGTRGLGGALRLAGRAILRRRQDDTGVGAWGDMHVELERPAVAQLPARRNGSKRRLVIAAAALHARIEDRRDVDAAKTGRGWRDPGDAPEQKAGHRAK